MTVRRLPALDPLGALLGAVGVAALAFLPFVVFKANRIVPGEARALLDFLPTGPVFGLYLMLALAAGTALFVANARTPAGGTPVEFQAVITSEIRNWTEIARSANIKEE